MITRRSLLGLILLGLLLLSACGIDAGPPSEVDSVPSGDPSFPAFTGSWVIDTTTQISGETIASANATLEKLRDDGIAEVVILVINGVDQPELYATRFGRHIELGSTETDNGLVYLLRPDGSQNEHIIYSVGRGLTRFTSGRVTDATQEASALANQLDFNAAVIALVQGTDSELRKLYEPRPETATGEDGEDEDLSPEETKALLTTIFVVAVIWHVIGLALMLVDVELGLHWILLFWRILAIAASKGSSKSTGGSGKFGGRSGSR